MDAIKSLLSDLNQDREVVKRIANAVTAHNKRKRLLEEEQAKKEEDALEGIFLDGRWRQRSIGPPRRIADIHDILVGQRVGKLAKNSQPPYACVKNSNGSAIVHEWIEYDGTLNGYDKSSLLYALSCHRCAWITRCLPRTYS